MVQAISNTSPLLYLHRIGSIDWLNQLFETVWTTNSVLNELSDGQAKGFDVPKISDLYWLELVNPNHMPQEWLSIDLGLGEISVMALALENPEKIVLLDDFLARRTAKAAGIKVWGTLKVLLEAKSKGIIPEVAPHIAQLKKSGMYLSEGIVRRVLSLAKEAK
ncbi:MAG: DUF3368 domain-containing protein [Desulfococcaceae bacterium]